MPEPGAETKLMFCRICLVTDCRLVHMDNSNLIQLYEEITGLSVSQEARLPRSLCAFCARRVSTHAQFRTRARDTHTRLSDILRSTQEFTALTIAAIAHTNTQPLIHTHNSEYEVVIHEEVVNSDDMPPFDTVNVDVEVKTEIESDTETHINATNTQTNTHDALDCSSSSSDNLPILRKGQAHRKVGRSKRKKKKLDGEVLKVDRRRKLLGDDLDDKIFISTLLTPEQQQTEFESRRDSPNYRNAVFRCAECYKGFLDEAAYTNHALRHTTACGLHRCPLCRLHFRAAHALRNHVTAHAHKYACRKCEYVTCRKQSARLHEEWHNGTKYQCPHCQEEFLKFTTYMGHVRIKHPTDAVCQLCGYSFVSEKGLRLHTRLKHRCDDQAVPPDGPHCESCDLRFLTAAARQRHLQISARHRDSKEPPPKKQRKTRDRDSNRDKQEIEGVKKRRASNKPEGPIPCEQCSLQLADSRAYYKHFRRCHPDKNRTNYPSMRAPAMCDVCGRMFQTLALLLDHGWVHTGEKRFQCEQCPKTFQQRQRLVAHRHVHSQQRATYQCSVCGKQFSTHSNRQRHMFSHTGLKPFRCELCSKCFKHASEKRAHINYVHLKKPWPRRRTKRDRNQSTEANVGEVWPRDAALTLQDAAY